MYIHVVGATGDLESGTKVHVIKGCLRKQREGNRRKGGREKSSTAGHVGCVLALAVSSDGRFLVSFASCF